MGLKTRLTWFFSIGLILMMSQVISADERLPRKSSWPSQKCPHVEVLGSDQSDKIASYSNSTIEDPEPEQLDVLGEALDMLPDLHCKAVRYVVFMNRKNSTVDGWTVKSMWDPDKHSQLYLNTAKLANFTNPWNKNEVDKNPKKRATAISVFIHEATHLVIRLMQSQQRSSPYRTAQLRPRESNWPADARQMAKDVISSNRLETGVIREWQRIHDSFVALGLAAKYYGRDWKEKANKSVDDLAVDGFMTAYGGLNSNEDIAEVVSKAIIREASEKREDGACKVMNSRTKPGINQKDAAIFTKLGFVRSLGFISEEQYTSCVGNLKIQAPTPGFFSYSGSSIIKSYTGNPRAAFGKLEGSSGDSRVYSTIKADGVLSTSARDIPVTVDFVLNITQPKRISDPDTSSYVSYPRGIYLIGPRHNRFNKLRFWSLVKEGDLIVDVGQGIALVSRASNEFIEGSVVIQRVSNYSGGLLSAIAGDEVVKGNRMTFRYKPGNN